MRRRPLLGSIGSAIAGALAGCLVGDRSEVTSPGAGDGSPTATVGTTPSPGTPSSRSFEIVDTSCGSGDDVATVSFGDGVVAIEGTIGGSNACVGARLADVDPEDGLVVAVQTVEPDDPSGCAQCVTDIEYEARIDFDGTLPSTVVVHHDGTTVTRARR